MRRLALLTAALLVLPLAHARAGEDLAVVVSGKPLGPVPTYQAGPEVYLEAKRAGALLGGQVYWYPVSGRVALTLRGRTIQFTVDTDEASSGEQSFKLPAPVKVRASKAFIPLSFLRSEAFARWSGWDMRFDPGTRTLELERRATVGPVRSFSYKDRTRIVLELDPAVSHSAGARGVGALEVALPYGVIEDDDRVELDDGVVRDYSLKQEATQARMSIRFADGGQRWRATELQGPRRLVLDVYAKGVAPPEKAPAPGAAESAAPAADKTAGPTLKQGPAPVETAIKPRRRRIVIDPGHGGKDPGAVSPRGVKEKDVNLAAALELARVLREHGDFEVKLTRETDEFVPLADRSKLANDMEADLFVSLHCNSAGSKRKTGFEVYSVSETASDPEAERLAAAENAALELEGKDPEEEAAKLILLAMTKTEMINESAPFAELVRRAISKRVDLDDHGHKQAAFYVLRGTHAPAILVEMAFLSHPKDEAKLDSRRFRRRMAEAIAAGIGDYARKKEWL